MRRPRGSRDLIEASIARIIPRSELSSIIDNIGLPYSSINMAYSTSAPIGTMDADVMVTLKPGHRPTDDYVHEMRERLPREFPGVTFYFLPADIISQILNFGLPAPIDIQVSGPNVEANHVFADQSAGSAPRRFPAPWICACISSSISPGLSSTWIAPKRWRAALRSSMSPATCWFP